MRVYPPCDATGAAATAAARRDDQPVAASDRCISCARASLDTPVVLFRTTGSGLMKMKRFLRRFSERITSFKDSPPPYRESSEDNRGQLWRRDINRSANETCENEVIDLLVNCRLDRTDEFEQSDVEYAEIQEMGLWHSTPLSQRHKSKISLTWVLKENLENTKPTEKLKCEERRSCDGECRHHTLQNQKYIEHERHRKCHSRTRDCKDRVVGRNEFYHDLRHRHACGEFAHAHHSVCSDDTSVLTEDYARRKHRHRRRRKKKSRGKFGYDIRDLDSFLSEASIDRPGNIPVVVAYPTGLHQTHKERQRELTLPLGTVVNAVFKNQQWLYAQTPHGEEGYVLYNACLPLGIIPNRTSSQKKTPCWESSTDIYPQPCGNLTDSEKEHVLRGRTRSESRRRPRNESRIIKANSCAEKDFDTLYLRTKSVCSNIDKIDFKDECAKKVIRQTLLVVNSDYNGNVYKKTLSVQKDDVVILVRGGENESNADWFYVRKRDGTQGFIPAAVAGHGYI